MAKTTFYKKLNSAKKRRAKLEATEKELYFAVVTH